MIINTARATNRSTEMALTGTGVTQILFFHELHSLHHLNI